MTRVIHPQYRDDAQGPYPFADRATLVSRGGRELDRELIVDAMLYPPLNVDPLCLLSIDITTETVTFVVGSMTSGREVCRGSTSFESPGAVSLEDAYGRQSGLLLLAADRVSPLRSWEIDNHVFGAAAAPFVVSCVSPESRTGVVGLVAEDGLPASGDVWFVGENGITLTVESGVIYVHVVGDPLWKRKVCLGVDAFTDTRFLKTINNIPPNDIGAWILAPGTLLSATPALRIAVEGTDIVIKIAGGE